MATVVIVGRKNVGKSTIFNRLTGMRMSVVYKEPGVTRDRIYGEVEWRGKYFDLIDTGGFYPDEDDSLAKKINKQIKYGIQEADLVYFVVDGKTGLRPMDEEICSQIRKTSKQTFLLVNKIDSKKDTMHMHEFSRLGFEYTFSVSAEAGIGFDSVLDASLRVLPETRKPRNAKTIRLIIMGRPNSGKSTLLNAITKEDRAIVDDKPGTTRDLVSATCIIDGKKLEIIDTCGLRRPSRVKEAVEFYSLVRVTSLVSRIHVAVLLFDTTQGIVDQDRRIASLIMSKAKGLVIVPNKIDLFGRKSWKRIVSSTYASFRSLGFVPVIPVSAKTGYGVEKMMTAILDVYRECGKTVDKETLQKIAVQIKPPLHGELINIKQLQSRPPIFRVTTTVSLKDSYIKYIRNSIRQYFGFSGTPVLIKTRVVSKRVQSHV
jgi:GTP-binding protein